MLKRERVSHLQQIPLFRGCSRRQLNDLASAVRVEQVDAGHVMLTQGAPSANVYLIVAGSVVVRRDRRKIATLAPGDSFGELGVLLGESRNASVEASTPVEMLVLDRTSLRRAIDKVPGLGWELLQSVASRLSESRTSST